MNFIEAMNEAMKKLHEACKTNEDWLNCRLCPFGDYCDAIEEAGLGTPDERNFLNNTHPIQL